MSIEVSIEGRSLTRPEETVATKDSILFLEWLECQKHTAAFDQAILEIRKYGFTFLTMLLTADGFLLGEFKVSHLGAMAICLVLLLIIYALFFIDRMHEVFLRAAVLRAMEIEEQLGLGVSTSISIWSESCRTATWGLGIYVFFSIAAAVLTVGALLDSPGSVSSRGVAKWLDEPFLYMNREIWIAIVLWIAAFAAMFLYHRLTLLRTDRHRSLKDNDPFKKYVDRRRDGLG